MADVVAASGTRTPAYGTVTVTIASPAVFSYTAHGLAAGDAVSFSTTGALPTGLVAGTTYYVIAAGLVANAFEVSATLGGAAVNTSGTQSGVHTVASECVLYQSVGEGSYMHGVDMSNMAAGDTVVLSAYKMVLATSALVCVYQQAFTGVQAPSTQQGSPLIQPPLGNVSKSGMVSVPLSTGLSTTGAVTFTISQTSGTARAFPWTVEVIA